MNFLPHVIYRVIIIRRCDCISIIVSTVSSCDAITSHILQLVITQVNHRGHLVEVTMKPHPYYNQSPKIAVCYCENTKLNCLCYCSVRLSLIFNFPSPKHIDLFQVCGLY